MTLQITYAYFKFATPGFELCANAKAPRRVHLDLVAGLVSFTMTCSVIYLRGLPLADGTGQALLSKRRERVNIDPRGQPSVCVGGLSVT